MIKVFKTNIDCDAKADKIRNNILLRFPYFKIHFDLEDSDRILRVEGEFFKAEDIIYCLNEHGYICINLPIELH